MAQVISTQVQFTSHGLQGNKHLAGWKGGPQPYSLSWCSTRIATPINTSHRPLVAHNRSESSDEENGTN